ncbi:MAG: TraR/DksA family transcriptional regulator [Candidatus Brocadiae bacterium]|nr:TraR/DksA family transcriptional regulator [Candidatus Brocadiia bacterium]
MKRLFSKEELKGFHKMLLDHRKALAGDVNHLEDTALRNQKDNAATHDISNFADLGTDYHEQELSIGLIENSEGTLRAIDAALLKIENGTYGYCEGIDDEDAEEEQEPHPIKKNRLKALPWARCCITCQRLMEQSAERL